MSLLVLYVLVVYTLFGIVSYQTFKPSVSDRTFSLWAVLLLVAGRLPVLLYNNELDVDESQLLTQALTLEQGAVFLRDIDSTTIGPLATCLLTLPGFLNIPIDYLDAHWQAAFLAIVIQLSFFQGARLLTNSANARLGLLMLTGFLALTANMNFLHFSSDMLPVALCSLAMTLAIGVRKAAVLSYGRVLLLGLLLGLFPYAKLQGMPLAPALVLGLLIRKDFFRDIKAVTVFLVGGMLPTGLVMVYCYAYDLVDDFMVFYINSNLRYGEMHIPYPLHALPYKLFGFFFISNPSFGFVLLLPALVSLLGLLNQVVRRRSFAATAFGLDFAWVALIWIMGLMATMKPGTYYGHHVLHMLIPTAYLFVFCITHWNYVQEGTERRRFQTAYVVLLGVLSVSLLVKSVRNEFYARIYTFETEAELATSGVARYLAAHTAQGEPVAIWGWHCKYNVQAQRPQAVAENHVQRCVFKTSIQRTHQERYLEDMLQNKPAIFLDASAHPVSCINDSTLYRLDRQPQLQALINRDYLFHQQIDKVRIYVRKDRFLSASVR